MLAGVSSRYTEVAEGSRDGKGECSMSKPDPVDCDAQSDLEDALTLIFGVAEVLMHMGQKDEVAGYLGGQLKEHWMRRSMRSAGSSSWASTRRRRRNGAFSARRGSPARQRGGLFLLPQKLVRHPLGRSLKYSTVICLDHIQLGIFEAHEQVKGGAWWTKRERPPRSPPLLCSSRSRRAGSALPRRLC